MDDYVFIDKENIRVTAKLLFEIFDVMFDLGSAKERELQKVASQLPINVSDTRFGTSSEQRFWSLYFSQDQQTRVFLMEREVFSIVAKK